MSCKPACTVCTSYYYAAPLPLDKRGVARQAITVRTAAGRQTQVNRRLQQSFIANRITRSVILCFADHQGSV